jgi:hypothetical protein
MNLILVSCLAVIEHYEMVLCAHRSAGKFYQVSPDSFEYIGKYRAKNRVARPVDYEITRAEQKNFIFLIRESIP